MFSDIPVGGFVVLCSGKPHYSKERRKVTYKDPVKGTLEVAGDLYDIPTGLLKGSHNYPRFGQVDFIRRIYLAEGEDLRMAIRGELMKKLSNLHIKDLKKLPDESLLEASALLGVTLQGV